MAAPPVKSQPLHNFSLPNLKWAHRNSAAAVASSISHHHHRLRRRESPDQFHHRRSTPDSEAETRPTNPKQQPSAVSPRNDTDVEENGESKLWNLRPRKEVTKTTSTFKRETAGEKNETKNCTNAKGVKSKRLRGLAEGAQLNGGVERQNKRKIWISLSREEIEEDVYALTGGRPARRPRKWPKTVQKQLDLTHTGFTVHDALRGISCRWGGWIACGLLQWCPL